MDLRNDKQESDLFIWEECGDNKRPNILYDSHKTNNDTEYLRSRGVHISDIGTVTKCKLS